MWKRRVQHPGPTRQRPVERGLDRYLAGRPPEGVAVQVSDADRVAQHDRNRVAVDRRRKDVNMDQIERPGLHVEMTETLRGTGGCGAAPGSPAPRA